MGYAALTGAGLLAAYKSARPWLAFILGVVSGVPSVALFLTLYPPWQITVAMVIAALVCGRAMDLSIGWRQFGLSLCGLLSIAIPAVAGWYLANSDAVSAIAGTYYPGHRTSASGHATLAWLLDAPLNALLAGPEGSSVSQAKSTVPYTNLSELSASWLPVPILAMATLAVLVYRRPPSARMWAGREPNRYLWTTVSVAFVLCVLLAWGLFPLPDWTGTLLLERVPGRRLPLAIGLASVLLVGVAGKALEGVRWSRWISIAWAAAAAATTASTVWSADRLPWARDHVSTTTVVALGAIVAIAFCFIASGLMRRTAAVLLASFAVWSWAMVNPLYHGLGPLDEDPVVRALRPIAIADPGVRMIVFADLKIAALVRASGAQILSGVTFYPDSQLMRELLPAQRSLWNNYALYRWIASEDAPAVIRQIKGTSMELHIYPCASKLIDLEPKWIVSDRHLNDSCLHQTSTVSRKGTNLYLYQIVR